MKVSAAYSARPRLKSYRVLDAGRETEASELFGDVARGLFSAGRPRPAAFELVGGEVVDVRAQALNIRHAAVGGPLLRDSGAGEEGKGDEREKEFAA